MGTIYNITWVTRQDPSRMLSFLLIKIDEYITPEYQGCRPGKVSVFPVTRLFDYQGVASSRTQFHLRLTFAITVHKNQGLTLSRVVLNLNQRDYCLGLAYVATSRVKHLNSLLFEGPFDFEYFSAKILVISQDKELDYTFRSTQLL
jgi:hypothetical protein